MLDETKEARNIAIIFISLLAATLLILSSQTVFARGSDDTGFDDSGSGSSGGSGSSNDSGSSFDDSSGRNRTFDDNPSASDLLPDDSRSRSGLDDNSSGSNSGPGSSSNNRNFEVRVEPRVVAPGATGQTQVFRSQDTREIEFRGRENEVEIEIEDASGRSRSIGDDGQKITLKFLTSGGEREVEFEAEGEKLRLLNSGVIAISRFPITLDQNGQLFVLTGNGLKVIRLLPDQAVEVAKQKGLITKINEIEVEFEDGDDEAVFKVKGQKLRRVLGFIPVNGNAEVKISAEKGTVLSSSTQPWWSFLSF